MEWTKEWPAKEGFYWFYGIPFKRWVDKYEPELHFVQVKKISNGICMITNGHFLYKQEGAEGVWQEVELPKLPISTVTLKCGICGKDYEETQEHYEYIKEKYDDPVKEIAWECTTCRFECSGLRIIELP